MKKLYLLALLSVAPFFLSAQTEFITTWKTDNPGVSEDNQITIPTYSGETYDYTVDWGDGTTDTNVTGDISHSYDSPGTYTVRISGLFPRIYCNRTPLSKRNDANKLISIDQWGTNPWTSMDSAFAGCSYLKLSATDVPDLSNLHSLRKMFYGCIRFTSQDNPTIGNWDISNITDLSGMFSNSSFNQDISSWNVSNVQDMSALFQSSRFNQDIGNWDVSHVTNMSSMFGSIVFNQDISNWDVGNVTNMESMFRSGVFNQDISSWNVSKVTNMGHMFNSSYFNRDISSWDISNVAYMEFMFDNSDLSRDNYDKILMGWSQLPSLQQNVSLGASEAQFCLGKDARDYLKSNFNWTFVDNGENCKEERPFITTWKTDNPGLSDDNQITIPTNSDETYDYFVDWGDGTSDSHITGRITHTYDSPGTYTVKISGLFPSIYFNGRATDPDPEEYTDASKLVNIKQWGTNPWTSMGHAFAGCRYLKIEAQDIPDLSNVQSLNHMFLLAGSRVSSLTIPRIEEWDISNVSNLGGMFRSTPFNQDISSWDVSNVIGMGWLFYNSHFNQNIQNWDVSKVTSMYAMFGSSHFNQDISHWNVSSVKTMTLMFYNSRFDQDVSSWDISNVESMNDMFSYSNLSTSNYDKILLGWSQLPSLVNGVNLGASNTAYCNSQEARQHLIDNYNWTIRDAGQNCDPFSFITTWKTDNPGISEGNQITIPTYPGATYDYSVDWGDGTIDTNVTGDISHSYDSPGTYTVRISGLFPRIYFNDTSSSTDIVSDGFKLISIDQWGTIPWTSMDSAFAGCSYLKLNATDVPDLSNLNSLRRMFYNCSSLSSQDRPTLWAWNISNITDLSGMFSNSSFNHELSFWDVSNVKDMSALFNSSKFNQDIGNWDVSNVTNMESMFSSGDFNQDISSWNISGVNDLSNMFDDTKLSTRNYDAILNSWSQLPSLVNGITLGANNTAYCNSQEARQHLIDNYNWIIEDAGRYCFQNSFITTWKTDNPGVSEDNQVTIPTFPYAFENYNYDVEWGDGTTDTQVKGDITHTYDVPGTYTVKITGKFPRIYFNYGMDTPKIEKDQEKLLSVEQWGDNQWYSMQGAFAGCINLDVRATDMPNLSQVTKASGMFKDCESLVGNASFAAWEVGTISTYASMFDGARLFNQNITNWDVRRATNMAYMFNSTSFNQNISSWEIGNVESMDGIFDYCSLSTSNYDKILLGWSQLPNLVNGVQLGASNTAFCNSQEARQHLMDNYNWIIEDAGRDCFQDAFITTWKTDNPGVSEDNQITIPTYPGESYDYSIDWGDGTSDSGVTGDITHTYDVPGTYTVKITGRFPHIYFNGSENISSQPRKDADKHKILSVDQWGNNIWNSFIAAFSGCSNLDLQAVDIPNMSSGPGLSSMFLDCTSLVGNSTIGEWDVSKVGMSASHMFQGATQFNQPLNGWDVSNIRYMDDMFKGATSFNQNLGSWDISSAENLSDIFNGTNLSTQNYDAILNSWSQLPNLENGVTLGASNIVYCNSQEARQHLMDHYNWTIEDAGRDCFKGAFITTWKTDNLGVSEDNQITIPTYPGESYDYNVDWGDGTTDTNVTGDISHTYASPGTYTVEISGLFPRIYFNDPYYDEFFSDADKLISIDQWGTNPWTSMDSAFAGCSYLKLNATDIPDLSNLTSLRRMFYVCHGFQNLDNTTIGNWDISNITDLSGMFANSGFNLDISSWNVSNVQDMSLLFHACPFNQDIGNWDVSNVQDMSQLFDASSFNQDIGNWDVSNVTNMSSMFHLGQFNKDISNWDVGQVTNMDLMFNSTYYDQDISSWDVSNVTSMRYMLSQSSFDQDISSWDISNVRHMEGLFNNCDLSRANYDKILIGWSQLPAVQPNVTLGANDAQFCLGKDARDYLASNFNWTFIDNGENCEEERPFITTWKTDNPGPSDDNQITIPTHPKEVYNYTVDWGDGTSDSGVTGDITHTYATPGVYQVSISGRFPQIYFNVSEDYPAYPDKDADIHKILSVDQWGTNRWKAFWFAFAGCSNLDVLAMDRPNMSAGPHLLGMFLDCTSLVGNSIIGEWDVSKADVLAAYMFQGATQFNQPLNGWDVSNIWSFLGMFKGATSFNQNLGSWDISSATNLWEMFNGTNLSTENYDAILNSWSQLSNLEQGITLGASNTVYCNSQEARQHLMDHYNWTIEDAGRDCLPGAFITTWKTDNPGVSEDNQITIPTFPGATYDYNVDWGDGSSDTNITGDITHTYEAVGTYQISIHGTFPRMYFNNLTVPKEILGDEEKILSIEQWGNYEWSSMDAAFAGCINLEVKASDTPELSKLSSLRSAFYNCQKLGTEGNFAEWDVSTVTNLATMFYQTKFNQDISNWNVSNVTNLNATFALNPYFNQNLNSWDVSNVWNLSGTFSGASAFNQPLNQWDVSNVRNFNGTFANTPFNQPLDNWDTGFAATMSAMFAEANFFNQDINDWDVSSVQNMGGMFIGATSFNQPLNSWNTTNVTQMTNMFAFASSFNQDISSWDVSNVTGMSSMFSRASSFNQDISDWDVSKVTEMRYMFLEASSFNQSVKNWDVSNVEDMNAMFWEATSFNQDLGGWDVSKVSDMENILVGANLSIENYNRLLIGWSSLPNLNESIVFDAGNSNYCGTTTERQHLIDVFGWNINDGGEAPFCNEDNDADGVMDNIDLCLDTQPGVTVNEMGCDLIPRESISLYALTPSCIGSTDGAIEISMDRAGYLLKIKVDGNGYSNLHETSSEAGLKLSNLAAGMYTISIAIPDIHFEQTYGITINELDAISATRTEINLTTGKASYTVSGSKNYEVTVNGQKQNYAFDDLGENTIVLENLRGLTDLTIASLSDCQGTITDSFFAGNIIQVYPTVTASTVNFITGHGSLEVKVFSPEGRLLKTKTYNQNEKLLDMSAFETGLYFIHLNLDGHKEIIKIIKK